MEPLKKCANGCDRPPDPPSLVICKKCQREITEKLSRMVEELKDEDKHRTFRGTKWVLKKK